MKASLAVANAMRLLILLHTAPHIVVGASFSGSGRHEYLHPGRTYNDLGIDGGRESRSIRPYPLPAYLCFSSLIAYGQRTAREFSNRYVACAREGCQWPR
jgi:hypothetical protein